MVGSDAPDKDGYGLIFAGSASYVDPSPNSAVGRNTNAVIKDNAVVRHLVVGSGLTGEKMPRST